MSPSPQRGVWHQWAGAPGAPTTCRTWGRCTPLASVPSEERFLSCAAPQAVRLAGLTIRPASAPRFVAAPGGSGSICADRHRLVGATATVVATDFVAPVAACDELWTSTNLGLVPPATEKS